MTQPTHVQKKAASGGKETTDIAKEEVEKALKKLGLTDDEIQRM